MCLAIPARILEINEKGDIAKVDFGDGTTREVNISLVEAKKGEFVIIHAGFAIQVMDEKMANETLQIWKEILGEEVDDDDHSP